MRLLPAFFLAMSLVGCKTGVTEADAARVQADFSQENYEKAMKEAGKEAELEAEKQAAAARDAQ